MYTILTLIGRATWFKAYFFAKFDGIHCAYDSLKSA